MKAIRIAEYGGSETLVLGDVDAPEPGEGEALIKIAYAGVNFIDVYMRSGLFKKLDTYPNKPPFTPGMEGAGTVEAVGPGVYTVAAWKLVRVPDGVPLDIATALQLQGMTAHYLTHSLFPLAEGHTCLIHAGAGGMGQLAIQLAKMRGAEVIVTVGSEEKAEIARQRGADHAILYRDMDFADAVLEITGGLGADVVYDSVGKDTIAGSLKCLKARGMLSNNGNASGPIGALDPLDLAEAGSVFFTRPHLASYIATPEERNQRTDDLHRLYREGKLTVTIDRELPLSMAKAAHDVIEERQSKGKILLKT